MDKIKQKAFDLKKTGWSYGRIAKELGIGRTTAYDYIREIKTGVPRTRPLVVRDSPEPSSEKGFEHSSRTEKIEETPILTIPEKGEKKKMKEFTGDELIEKKFDSLDFDGKFFELIGKPSRLFSGIIWGLPKGGKSNFSIRFADYLQEYFGDVVYVAAEEGESVTLQEKIRAIGGSKITFAENRDRESIRKYLAEKQCDFVFIDSINNAGIDSDFLELIKKENPLKSFISIVQATKGGNFKGDQSLTHNCDFVIRVIAGVAYHYGRFNTETEISIFEGPLYEKNPLPRKNLGQFPEPETMEAEIIEPLEESASTESEEVTVLEKLIDPKPEPKQQYLLSSLLAGEQLVKIARLNQINLPKTTIVKTPPVQKVPPLPISPKVYLWTIGIAGALSLIESIFKNRNQENKK